MDRVRNFPEFRQGAPASREEMRRIANLIDRTEHFETAAGNDGDVGNGGPSLAPNTPVGFWARITAAYGTQGAYSYAALQGDGLYVPFPGGNAPGFVDNCNGFSGNLSCFEITGRNDVQADPATGSIEWLAQGDGPYWQFKHGPPFGTSAVILCDSSTPDGTSHMYPATILSWADGTPPTFSPSAQSCWLLPLGATTLAGATEYTAVLDGYHSDGLPVFTPNFSGPTVSPVNSLVVVTGFNPTTCVVTTATITGNFTIGP